MLLLPARRDRAPSSRLRQDGDCPRPISFVHEALVPGLVAKASNCRTIFIETLEETIRASPRRTGNSQLPTDHHPVREWGAGTRNRSFGSVIDVEPLSGPV